MIASDAFRANRLVWRFKKSGDNGRLLMVVANLDEAIRARLVALANIQAPELAAIGLFRSDDDWLLITSRRIVWSKNGEINNVYWSTLLDATIDADDLITAGGKDRVDVLTVVTDAGKRRLLLESGPPLSGAWNAIKMAVAWKEDSKITP